MIENFIDHNIKDLTKEEALGVTTKEKIKVHSELKVMGCDILHSAQKSNLLNSEGLSLWYYYHDLDWLSNLLNGKNIINFDRIELHDKLKIILTKEGLI